MNAIIIATVPLKFHFRFLRLANEYILPHSPTCWCRTSALLPFSLTKQSKYKGIQYAKCHIIYLVFIGFKCSVMFKLIILSQIPKGWNTEELLFTVIYGSKYWKELGHVETENKNADQKKSPLITRNGMNWRAGCEGMVSSLRSQYQRYSRGVLGFGTTLPVAHSAMKVWTCLRIRSSLSSGSGSLFTMCSMKSLGVTAARFHFNLPRTTSSHSWKDTKTQERWRLS